MTRLIRTTGKAMIVKDNRLLVIKIKDHNEEWFIMPGGGQLENESLPETVRREVFEETGINILVGDLVFVIEGIHGESFHRIDNIFYAEYISIKQNPDLIIDNNQVGFEWIPLHDLNLAPLYPSKLRRAIMNYYEGKKTSIYLGNEEINDPEIKD